MGQVLGSPAYLHSIRSATIAEALGAGLDWLVGPLLLALVWGPVFWLPLTQADPFRVPSETWIVTGSWLLVAVIGAARALRGEPFLGGGRRTQRALLFTLVGWLCLTSLCGIHATAHWGYATTVIAYLLMAQSVVGWLEADLDRRWIVVIGLAGLVGLEVVCGTLQWARFPFGAYERLLPLHAWAADWLHILKAHFGSHVPIGTLGNPNYLGELLALTLPVVGGAAWGLKRRGLQGVAVVVVAAAGAMLLATSARAAVSGFVLGGALAAGIMVGPGNFKFRTGWNSARTWRVIVAGCVIFSGMAGLVGGPLLGKFQHLASGDESLEDRVVNWKAASHYWLDHPIAGTGLGGFKLVSVAGMARTYPEGLSAVASSNRFYQLHNDPLQTLVELGAVGVGLFGALLLFWIKAVRSNPTLAVPMRLGLIWGVLALGIASLFGFPFHIPLTALAFSLTAAVGLAGPPDPARSLLAIERRWASLAFVCIVTAAMAIPALQRGVWPLFWAGQDAYLADHTAQDRRQRGELYGMAARQDRFKAMHLYNQALALFRENRHVEAIALLDAHPQEGLGMDAVFLRGASLQSLKRYREAIAAYQRVIRYYDASHQNHEGAKRRIATMEAEMSKGPATESR